MSLVYVCMRAAYLSIWRVFHRHKNANSGNEMNLTNVWLYIVWLRHTPTISFKCLNGPPMIPLCHSGFRLNPQQFLVGICSLPLTVFHIIWALGFASMKRSATKRVRVKVRRKVRIKRKDKQHSARPTPKLALPAPPPLHNSLLRDNHSHISDACHHPHHHHHPSDPRTHLYQCYSATPYHCHHHCHLPHPPKPPSAQERKVDKVPSANQGSNDGSSEWKGSNHHLSTCQNMSKSHP